MIKAISISENAAPVKSPGGATSESAKGFGDELRRAASTDTTNSREAEKAPNMNVGSNNAENSSPKIKKKRDSDDRRQSKSEEKRSRELKDAKLDGDKTNPASLALVGDLKPNRRNSKLAESADLRSGKISVKEGRDSAESFGEKSIRNAFELKKGADSEKIKDVERESAERNERVVENNSRYRDAARSGEINRAETRGIEAVSGERRAISGRNEAEAKERPERSNIIEMSSAKEKAEAGKILKNSPAGFERAGTGRNLSAYRGEAKEIAAADESAKKPAVDAEVSKETVRTKNIAVNGGKIASESASQVVSKSVEAERIAGEYRNSRVDNKTGAQRDRRPRAPERIAARDGLTAKLEENKRTALRPEIRQTPETSRTHALDALTNRSTREGSESETFQILRSIRADNDSARQATAVADKAGGVSKGEAGTNFRDAIGNTGLPENIAERVSDLRESGKTAVNGAREAFDKVRSEILDSAKYMKSPGRSSMEIQLNPPRLGRIQLDITFEDEKLEVRVRVENEGLREMMRAEMNELIRTVRDVHSGSCSMDVTDFESGFSREREQFAQTGNPEFKPDNPGAEEGEARSRSSDYYQPIAHEGHSLDLLV